MKFQIAKQFTIICNNFWNNFLQAYEWENLDFTFVWISLLLMYVEFQIEFSILICAFQGIILELYNCFKYLKFLIKFSFVFCSILKFYDKINLLYYFFVQRIYFYYFCKNIVNFTIYLKENFSFNFLKLF